MTAGDCARCGTPGVDLDVTGADGLSVCDTCRDALLASTGRVPGSVTVGTPRVVLDVHIVGPDPALYTGDRRYRLLVARDHLCELETFPGKAAGGPSASYNILAARVAYEDLEEIGLLRWLLIGPGESEPFLTAEAAAMFAAELAPLGPPRDWPHPLETEDSP